MPRLPRFYVPSMPLHVIQRGNNRSAIFNDVHDFRFYLECLAHARRRHGVALHAYVLMTNHVHLLATPRHERSMPAMMQSIGRIYVRYFNQRYERTGTLWEGRYRSTIVDDESYLFACMRYIETNPVRAGMVENPHNYPWSSFAANGLGAVDALIEPHATYRTLGHSAPARCAAYRALFEFAIPQAEIANIRDATQHGWALGTAAFRSRISTIARRADRIKTGRRPRADDVGADGAPLPAVCDETPL